MEITGKIIVIGDTQTVGSAGTFKKRLIVIETDEQYKQTIPVDFTQDKCSVLDGYKLGENVKVSINIRGNEYEGKYYVSLQGWRIERQTTAEPKPAEKFEPTTSFKEEEQDDLPF